MHFPDLTLYRYGPESAPTQAGNWSVPLLAVGWLESSHQYSRGSIPSFARIKLRELLRGTAADFLHCAYCGEHECSLCNSAHNLSSSLEYSGLNIFVPGKYCVYVAPGAIDHYFEFHNYRPPDSFCEAVMRCPVCTSPMYREALREVNGGSIPIPLWIKGKPGSYQVIPDNEA